MNPMRVGRTILFILPYLLITTGILVAVQQASGRGSAAATLQALGVAAVGFVWAYVRGRRSR